ncbi:MAG: hypothetical protein A3G87_10165 [Omnitrophica bacterium RIFCSPLOWO2_12_FULL_50_11]|nr:MAG: hypothetical protein A3G87_10165 [Omnitrophica bacterium RIFCSPLOWO2_12_FULL_50_11]
MPNWIHLNFSFEDYPVTSNKLHDDLKQDPPTGSYKEFVSYVKKIVDGLRGSFISRYFFLFEGDSPGPHLFLALELNSHEHVKEIESTVNGVERPDFVASIDVKPNSGDESNGEAAIDFFHATTNYAFFRVGPAYKPGYENNDPTKLVHCFCNQLFFSRERERTLHSKFL